LRSNPQLDEEIASGGFDTATNEHVAYSTTLAMTLSLQRPVLDPMRSQIFPKLFLHHRFVIGPIAETPLRLGDDQRLRRLSLSRGQEPGILMRV